MEKSFTTTSPGRAPNSSTVARRPLLAAHLDAADPKAPILVRGPLGRISLRDRAVSWRRAVAPPRMKTSSLRRDVLRESRTGWRPL